MRGSYRSIRLPVLIGCGMVLALAASSRPAKAGIVSFDPGTSFATTPDTIAFGSGSVVLSAVPGFPPDDVATTGSDTISTFFGAVSDFSAGSSIDQNKELYTFAAYSSPSAIPNSAADDFIGVAFDIDGAVHYGYLEVAGTTLVSYAYETVADTTITTGAIPEPATIGLLVSGVVAVAGLRRRGRSQAGLTAAST